MSNWFQWSRAFDIFGTFYLWIWTCCFYRSTTVRNRYLWNACTAIRRTYLVQSSHFKSLRAKIKRHRDIRYKSFCAMAVCLRDKRGWHYEAKIRIAFEYSRMHSLLAMITVSEYNFWLSNPLIVSRNYEPICLIKYPVITVNILKKLQSSLSRSSRRLKIRVAFQIEFG